MRHFIIKNKIINSNQYGFIEKSNTTVSHINLYFILSIHNTNNKISTVFLDLKKTLIYFAKEI